MCLLTVKSAGRLSFRVIGGVRVLARVCIFVLVLVHEEEGRDGTEGNTSGGCEGGFVALHSLNGVPDGGLELSGLLGGGLEYGFGGRDHGCALDNVGLCGRVRHFLTFR